jgi:hypothetical protein
MTPVEVLRAARAKIEQGWTQHAFARNGIEPVPSRSVTATCWCAIGAITAANGSSSSSSEVFLERAVGTDDVPAWNDAPGRTQAEVLAAFDRAIALAEAQS